MKLFALLLATLLSTATLSIAILSIATLSSATYAVAAEPIRSDHAQKALDIFRTIVEVDTSKTKGNTLRVAQYLADELIAAGIPKDDVEVIDLNGFASLVARYRGDGSSGNKPILLLGHLDVVEALESDWERPPFELTQDATNFYGRGTDDNKFGIAQLTSTFIRFKKEGFVPNRDLILVFSGDEESDMATTRMLANERPDIAEAEYALNSDAGRGDLDANGNPVSYLIQVAEKTYATWEITARNAGGHSARPRADNAIYDLADAIRNIENHQFPVRYSEMTLSYFQATGNQLGGELGAAMQAFAMNPKDEKAVARLAREPAYIGTTRTTCVLTMLRGGHAENALPQSATATVNCRIFPGVSVAETEQTLVAVVANEAIEFDLLLPTPVESPISELRADVLNATTKAVHARYPGIKIIPSMESGGTDGMHFRSAGIPTFGIRSIFMDPSEMFAHGLNERVPIKAFYDALDHWSIVLKELAGPKQAD